MKSILLKLACFSLIATFMFFALYYFTEIMIFNYLSTLSIIVTAFCFLAFIFCIIFKKEINGTKNTNDNNSAE